MDLPANRPRVARKKFWCQFLKRTVRYESHLVTISAKHFQKSSAICPAFFCHFLPSMLCVPAPCVMCNSNSFNFSHTPPRIFQTGVCSPIWTFPHFGRDHGVEAAAVTKQLSHSRPPIILFPTIWGQGMLTISF